VQGFENLKRRHRVKISLKKFRRNEMLVATEFIPLKMINDTKQSSLGTKYIMGSKIWKIYFKNDNWNRENINHLLKPSVREG